MLKYTTKLQKIPIALFKINEENAQMFIMAEKKDKKIMKYKSFIPKLRKIKNFISINITYYIPFPLKNPQHAGFIIFYYYLMLKKTNVYSMFAK